MTPMSAKRIINNWGGLIVALGLTAALQLVIVAHSPLIAWDGITFIEIAQSLAQDPAWTVRVNDQHPGFPAMLCCARYLLEGCMSVPRADSWILPARVVTSLFGLVSVVLVWLLAYRIAGLRIANWSAVLFAALPVPRQNAADVLSDTPHLAFYLAAVWLLCEGLMRRSYLAFGIAGVCSGLAFLVRPEGLSVAIVGVAFVLASRSLLDGLSWNRPLAGLALTLGAAVLVTPYLLGAGKLTSKITAKPGWQALRTGAGRTDEVTSTSAPSSHHSRATTATSNILSSGLLGLARGFVVFCERLAECWRYLLIVPLIVGIPIALRQVPRATSRLLLALAGTHIGLLHLLFLLGGYIERRHLLPLLALLTPAVAIGLIQLVGIARKRARPVQIAVWALLFLVLIPRSVRPLHGSQLNKYTVAEFLHRCASPADLAMSNSIHILFYADRLGRVGRGKMLWSETSIEHRDVATHRFAAIEVDSQNYDNAWLEQLDKNYARLRTFRGDASRNQRDIILFDSRPNATVAAASHFLDEQEGSWTVR